MGKDAQIVDVDWVGLPFKGAPDNESVVAVHKRKEFDMFEAVRIKHGNKPGFIVGAGDFVALKSGSRHEEPYVGRVIDLYEKSKGRCCATVQWMYRPKDIVEGKPADVERNEIFYALRHIDEVYVDTILKPLRIEFQITETTMGQFTKVNNHLYADEHEGASPLLSSPSMICSRLYNLVSRVVPLTRAKLKELEQGLPYALYTLGTSSAQPGNITSLKSNTKPDELRSDMPVIVSETKHTPRPRQRLIESDDESLAEKMDDGSQGLLHQVKKIKVEKAQRKSAPKLDDTRSASLPRESVEEGSEGDDAFTLSKIGAAGPLKTTASRLIREASKNSNKKSTKEDSASVSEISSKGAASPLNPPAKAAPSENGAYFTPKSATRTTFLKPATNNTIGKDGEIWKVIHDCQQDLVVDTNTNSPNVRPATRIGLNELIEMAGYMKLESMVANDTRASNQLLEPPMTLQSYFHNPILNTFVSRIRSILGLKARQIGTNSNGISLAFLELERVKPGVIFDHLGRSTESDGVLDARWLFPREIKYPIFGTLLGLFGFRSVKIQFLRQPMILTIEIDGSSLESMISRGFSRLVSNSFRYALVKLDDGEYGIAPAPDEIIQQIFLQLRNGLAIALQVPLTKAKLGFVLALVYGDQNTLPRELKQVHLRADDNEPLQATEDTLLTTCGLGPFGVLHQLSSAT